jgi:hypothetical protein
MVDTGYQYLFLMRLAPVTELEAFQPLPNCFLGLFHSLVSFRRQHDLLLELRFLMRQRDFANQQKLYYHSCDLLASQLCSRLTQYDLDNYAANLSSNR